MGSWNGTQLGLKVRTVDQKLAEQLLVCLDVTPKEYIIEEVRRLSQIYTPSVYGKADGTLLGIMPVSEKHFTDYINQFYYFGDEEDEDEEEWDDEDDEDEEEWDDEDDEDIDTPPCFDFTLDDLFQLTNKLFPSAYVYMAHEEGNNTSDDYYRYEAILDPKTGKKTELNCFYSYGEGINIDSDDPREEGTKTTEVDISNRPLSPEVIDWLIKKAQTQQFSELAERLSKCM